MYADRILAVELYIKLGKRVRAPIRQQRLDLPAGCAVRAPKYTEAQKKAAVEHYLTHDRCRRANVPSCALIPRNGGRFRSPHLLRTNSKDQLRGCSKARTTVDAASMAVRVRGPVAP